MIRITDESRCCGCGACAAVCPVSCIEMKPKTLGAVFPYVDTRKCISCGKCDMVCPMQSTQLLRQTDFEQQVYAAYAENKDIRFLGSSGGVFGVLAKYLLSKGYKVYGAAFDSNMHLQCMPAEDERALAPLMKSKYLQSDLTRQFDQIKKDLEHEKKVLFVSTPCQVGALKNYLGKDYEGLISVDFLCHGVPSQAFFDQCIAYEDRQHKCKTLQYSFRSKITRGATPHYFTVKVEKKGRIKTVTKPYYKSVFYAFFQQYITLRESCYDCIFAEQNRVSDMTIGDFHTIEKYEPSVNRFEGISTVVINSPKGRQLFEDAKSRLWHKEFSLNKLMEDGVLFSEKTKRPDRRDVFVESYCKSDFDSFVKQNLPRKKYLIFGIYYVLPSCVRRIIKKICHIE